ncbi:hypothetical protein ACQKL5_00070 [Peribacillus sp. NPDC097675]|uniref:hypothetical protein n=1 Tax=Peribacillus sp. NPDC097675 TaxID=3390618 RepID=UPI003D02C875
MSKWKRFSITDCWLHFFRDNSIPWQYFQGNRPERTKFASGQHAMIISGEAHGKSFLDV